MTSSTRSSLWLSIGLSVQSLIFATRASAQPSTPPPEMSESEEVEQIVAGLSLKNGGMFWVDSLQIAFDAVEYNASDVEKTRYQYSWDRLSGEVAFNSVLADGRPWSATFNEDSVADGRLLVDGIVIEKGPDSSALAFAHLLFLEHSRTLFLPFLLGDSTVIVRKGSDTILNHYPMTEMEVIFTESPPGMARHRLFIPQGLPMIGLEVVERSGTRVERGWDEMSLAMPFYLSMRRTLSSNGGYLRFENLRIDWLGTSPQPWPDNPSSQPRGGQMMQPSSPGGSGGSRH